MGLPSKSIIDIAVGVASLSEMDSLIEPLLANSEDTIDLTGDENTTIKRR